MGNYPKEVEIPVPWGTIQGMWWGKESDEPIVFMHGWQDNLCTFDRLIPLLPPDLPYFAFDLPGHGKSSPYPKGEFYYLFWDGLLNLRRIVKHFGWKKISIIGHSLGGALGFLYAATYPDEVETLVSLDIVCPRVSKPSTLVERTSKCLDKFLEYETLPDSKQPCYEYEDMVGTALDGYAGSVTRHGIVTLFKRGIKPSNIDSNKYVFTRDVRLKVAGLGMPSLDIVLEYATKIKCNYLNIRAKNGLKLESPEIYPMVLEKIKSTAKRFEYHEVSGTHHVHLNTPENVAPIVAKFFIAAASSNHINNHINSDGSI